MFSVVIPLYNKELSIQNTIYSVLNQTVQDFEIVIVNDGSTDNSVEKVVEIIDARIRIINKPNGGVSSARNMGVEEAKYEWIAFLDGDDLWQVNHLEEIVKMMKLFPNEKIYATSFEYSDKRIIFKHPRESEIFVIDNYFREALKEPLIWTSIVVINKECFCKVGYFNTALTHGEDLDIWSRMANSYSIIKNSLITATYSVDAENKVTNSKFKYDKHFISIIDLNNVKSKEEKQYYLNIVYVLFKGTILKKDFISFCKILKKYHFYLLGFFFKNNKFKKV